MFNSFEQTHINQYCIKHVRLLFITFVNIFTLQDRKASEKAKEIERVREKQQKELSKQKQIEKVCYFLFFFFLLAIFIL